MAIILLGGMRSAYAQDPGFHLEGTESRPLPVTGRKMTTIIFPVDVAAGVRVSRDVLVQKVKGVENVIELKAVKRDFAPTSLAVYGKDGRLYSFVLHYVEDTSVLDYRVVRNGDSDVALVRLTDWPVSPEQIQQDAIILEGQQSFLRRRAAADGMQLTCKGIYLRDSLLWLSLELQDLSPMGFRGGSLRIYTEDKKKVRRTATQEMEVVPVYSGGLGIVDGGGGRAIAVALHPFLLAKGKRLVIAISDEAGDREVKLRLKGKVLLKARRG